jgi:hypothetical protein
LIKFDIPPLGVQVCLCYVSNQLKTLDTRHVRRIDWNPTPTPHDPRPSLPDLYCTTP